MNDSKLKPIIISLIKDDIINTKLVNAFTKNGIDANDYLLNISDAVFELLGINEDKRTDELFGAYIRFIQSGIQLNPNRKTNELEDLCNQIYWTLEQFKK